MDNQFGNFHAITTQHVENFYIDIFKLGRAVSGNPDTSALFSLSFQRFKGFRVRQG